MIESQIISSSVCFPPFHVCERVDGIANDASTIYYVPESFLKCEATLVENRNHFPKFSRQPDEAFITAWHECTVATGYPERFDGVSTSRPKQMRNIILLSEEIRVPVSLREGGERVPCPFCSPGNPKFERGRMAYFPDECVVRFVGHKCAKTHFGENYAAAERIFERQMRCRRYIGLWSEINARRAAISALLDAIQPVADAVETVRERIEEQAPNFCGFLRNEMAQTKGELSILKDLGQKDRNGNAILQRALIGTAAGLLYLAKEERPLRRILNARAALLKTESPLPAWEATSPEHESTKEVLQLGRGVARSLREVPHAIDVVRDAQAFLRSKNIALINRWGSRSDSPFAQFRMVRETRQIRIQVESFAGPYYATPLAASEHLESPLPPVGDSLLQWLKELVA